MFLGGWDGASEQIEFTNDNDNNNNNNNNNIGAY